MGKLENPLTGRWAFCVRVEKDQFGTMIVEEVDTIVEEVTSFMSNRFTRNLLNRVIPQLIRAGYFRVIYSEVDLTGWLR